MQTNSIGIILICRLCGRTGSGRESVLCSVIGIFVSLPVLFFLSYFHFFFLSATDRLLLFSFTYLNKHEPNCSRGWSRPPHATHSKARRLVRRQDYRFLSKHLSNYFSGWLALSADRFRSNHLSAFARPNSTTWPLSCRNSRKIARKEPPAAPQYTACGYCVVEGLDSILNAFFRWSSQSVKI